LDLTDRKRYLSVPNLIPVTVGRPWSSNLNEKIRKQRFLRLTGDFKVGNKYHYCFGTIAWY